MNLQGKTPAEIIENLYQRLKQDLEHIGIRVSRVGFFGFLVNLIGWSQYDVFNYYNQLFREVFPETALDLNSLLFHASRYKVPISFAEPSSLTGVLRITCPNVLFTPIPNNSERGQIYLIRGLRNSLIPDLVDKDISPYQIKINDITFTSEADYYIEANFAHNNNFCRIIDNQGQTTVLPLSGSEWIIPLKGIYQYDLHIEKTRIPVYPYGTYYDYDITTVSYDQIYDILVFVNEDGNWVKYDVLFSEFTADANAPVVFFHVIPNGVRIRFGSGLRGRHVQNRDVVICLKVTHGENGRISPTTVAYNTSATVIYTGNAKTTSLTRTYTDIIKLDVEAIGGKAAFSPDDLRKQVLDYIVTRNNLVSRTDFRNVFSKYYTTFELIFRKIHVFDNTITLLIPLYDKYQTIVRTTSETYLETDFNPDDETLIYLPERTISSGVQMVSPFLYKYDEAFDRYIGYLVFDNIEIPLNTITIYDESVRQPSIKWTLTYTDKSYFYVESQEELLDYDFTIDFQNNNYQMSPISDYRFVWAYENPDTKSFILDQNFPVTLHIFHAPHKQLSGTCTIDSSDPTKVIGNGTSFTSEVQPGDWFWLEVDGITKRVKVDSIIDDVTLVLQEAYTGSLNASSPAYIQHVSHEISCIVSTVTQCLDMSTLVSIPKYTQNNVTYVVDVPFVEKSVWLVNKDYIRKQLLKLTEMSVDVNQMITDNVKVAFLNSVSVTSEYVPCIFIQKYTTDLVLPLKMTVNIVADRERVVQEGIDLRQMSEQLLIELSKLLVSRYTGTSVTYYDSHIIHYFKDKYAWIKDVCVSVTDSAGTEYKHGFELHNVDDILRCIWSNTSDKLKVLRYIPVVLYWDINNLQLNIM